MKNKDKIYFEVETEQEKIDELIKSLEKFNEKVDQLKKLGVSNRNLNRILKDIIKVNIK